MNEDELMAFIGRMAIKIEMLSEQVRTYREALQQAEEARVAALNAPTLDSVEEVVPNADNPQ